MTPKAKKRTVGRLDSPQALRRELGRLYRDGRLGEMDAGDVSKLASVLAIMARILEQSDIAARVERLEALGAIPRHNTWRN